MKLWKIGTACLLFGAAAWPCRAQEAKTEEPTGERLQRLVQRFDKDGDGKLGDEERAAAREALQGESSAPRPAARPEGTASGLPGGSDLNPAQVFERLDRNRDGKIAKDELGDANGDGDISKEEFQAVFAPRREPVAGRPYVGKEMFARLDQNSDNKLTKEELGERGQWLLQADENKDGEVTLEEFDTAAARLRATAPENDPAQFFARLDVNSDGKLQKDELRGPFAERAAEIDTDKDGDISKEEFKAVIERMRGPNGGRPGQPPNVDEIFTQFDKDSDGKLTKEELPERIAAFLLRADGDGDGAITKDELKAARERLQSNREVRPAAEGETKRPESEDSK